MLGACFAVAKCHKRPCLITSFYGIYKLLSWAGSLVPTITPKQTPILVDTANVSATQLLSLPKKLVKRMLELEFVDMSKLVPDTWRYNEDAVMNGGDGGAQSQTFCSGLNAIPLWWVFFPRQNSSIQQTIVKAHRFFIGEGWVTYDTCYHRKAAIT